MSEIERRRARVEAGLLPERILDTDDWRPVSIDERRRRLGIAGLSVAVIDGGQIEWAAGYGFADEPERRPVTTETLFLAGSISKMVNALAVMRLVEAGALDLDADVNERLRSWRVPANGAWQPVVTLRQLLSHTAGLTTHGFPGYAVGIPVPSVPALLEGEGNTPPVRVNLLPGLHFRYSGGGTTVVQQLLVDVTGEPYPELLRRLVLEPVGSATVRSSSR